MNKFNALILIITLGLFPILVGEAEEPDTPPKVLQPSQDGVQRTDIIVDSYSYKPSNIVVTVGKPVELNLRSVSSVVPHNFVIDDPESGIEINETVPSGRDLLVSFTPRKTGEFKFYCSKSGIFGSHLDKGMEGTIKVVE